MKKLTCRVAYSILFANLLFAVSCSPKYQQFVSNYAFKSDNGGPDYSSLDYWAAHPYKKDLADSVPYPLRTSYYTDSTVDVFFVHPTTFTDESTEANASIDDAYTNAKTDHSTILYQASVFNGPCRVFAPRYRQANISMYFTGDTAISKKAFDVAYEDVKAAFEYFLKYYNQGRPIIIASHSQGTTHAKKLLKEYFETGTLKNRLVCAYLLGIPVETHYFTDLKPCKDSLSTGCFVSWRTFRKGYEGPNFISGEKFTAVVVNPLTWTCDTVYAAKSLNKGAVLYKFNKVYQSTNDAQIHKNILWISKPKFPGGLFYRSKNYHPGDYNLFYLNIRDDVRRRIGLFWKH